MKKHLLPHKYQKLALIAFIADLVLVVATNLGTLFTAEGSLLYNVLTSGWLQLILSWIMYISVLVFIFSREKIEDEFIVWCRLRSVTFTAIIGVAIILVLDLVQASLSGASYSALKLWRQDHFWNGNFQLWMLIIYALIFKLFVKHFSISEEDEE